MSQSDSNTDSRDLTRRSFLVGSAAALSAIANMPARARSVQSANRDRVLIAEQAEKSSSNYYNVALYPQDDAFKQECVKLARTNLSQRADSYLLGEGAYPHITLCQFQCQEERLSDIWKKVSKLLEKPIEISFRHIYISPDRKDPALVWVGLAVKPTPQLIQLQKDVFDSLHQIDINSTTKTNDYFPHITWARCKSKPPFSLNELPPPAMYLQSYPFTMSLALSNEIGVYRKRLFH